MRRQKMSRKQNRKSFRRGTRVHTRNVPSRPMRGGFRL